MRDIGKLRKHLKEEYQIGAKDKWFEQLKRGQFKTQRRIRKRDQEAAASDETKEAKFATEYDEPAEDSQVAAPKNFKQTGGRKPKQAKA